jgi:hypothetical protein
MLAYFATSMLACSYAARAESGDVKSGPQAGENLPGPFNALVVYSKVPGLVGKRTDFFEMYGPNPVVLVFARELAKPLTRLVNELDAAAARHKSAKLRIAVILLSDDDALENTLKAYANNQELRHVSLAITEPERLKNYKLAKDADVTVLLYTRRQVQANHTFKQGEPNEKGRESVLADLPKITRKP